MPICPRVTRAIIDCRLPGTQRIRPVLHVDPPRLWGRSVCAVGSDDTEASELCRLRPYLASSRKSGLVHLERH
jgi:hypothetical protein